MDKTYCVSVRVTADLIYEVEASSQKEAIEEAIAMAEGNEVPTDVICAEIGKATIEKNDF